MAHVGERARDVQARRRAASPAGLLKADLCMPGAFEEEPDGEREHRDDERVSRAPEPGASLVLARPAGPGARLRLLRGWSLGSHSLLQRAGLVVGERGQLGDAASAIRTGSR